MSRLGSATGNGAAWPTRVADSGGISQTSVVASMNSSRQSEAADGRPSRWRCRAVSARSKRPLLAMTTRSVRSRRTAFAGRWNDPQAQDADDIRGQRAVGPPAEVGDVDGDATPGLQLADALAEHLLEHLQVLQVRR